MRIGPKILHVVKSVEAENKLAFVNFVEGFAMVTHLKNGEPLIIENKAKVENWYEITEKQWVNAVTCYSSANKTDCNRKNSRTFIENSIITCKRGKERNRGNCYFIQ